MPKQAITEFQLCRRTGPYPARAYAAMENRPEALRQLRNTQQPPAPEYISRFHIARVCVTLGEKEKALAWLQERFDGYAEGMAWLKVDPALKPMPRQHRVSRIDPFARPFDPQLWKIPAATFTSFGL